MAQKGNLFLSRRRNSIHMTGRLYFFNIIFFLQRSLYRSILFYFKQNKFRISLFDKSQRDFLCCFFYSRALSGGDVKKYFASCLRDRISVVVCIPEDEDPQDAPPSVEIKEENTGFHCRFWLAVRKPNHTTRWLWCLVKGIEKSQEQPDRVTRSLWVWRITRCVCEGGTWAAWVLEERPLVLVSLNFFRWPAGGPLDGCWSALTFVSRVFSSTFHRLRM